MSVSLQSFLASTYKILGLYDLAEISENPYKVYQILKQHHREKFLPDQVIVFYTQYIPTEQLLSHLYDSANLIDVDPTFILLCGPIEIQTQIEKICKLNNNFKFVNIIVPSNALQNKFILHETFCPIPWASIEVRENGSIFPCCVSRRQVGSINDGLKNTFLNENMNLLRQEFLNGGKPHGCGYCWEREAKNLISNRIRYRKFMIKELLIRGLDNPYITHLDLKCGKTCNFKCRICNSSRSSAFAEEEAKVNKTKFVINKNWSEDLLNNMSQIEQLLPNIQNIDMTGGEPFLVKSLVKLLKIAVDQGHAKNIRLHYNTNGSIYPKEFIQYWPNFKEVDIHFSIDAIGKKFELERGGIWKEVENNILKIKNLNLPNLKLAIYPSISIMNVFYLDEVLDWANLHNFVVNPNHVLYPEALSLSQLTSSAKKYLIDKFEHYSLPEIQKIIQYIQKIPDSDGKKFNDMTKYFDSIRNENFSDSHPEIAKAMGYSSTNE